MRMRLGGARSGARKGKSGGGLVFARALDPFLFVCPLVCDLRGGGRWKERI